MLKFTGKKWFDANPPPPVSKLERLIMGPIEGAPFNGSGSMAPAFFHKDGGEFISLIRRGMLERKGRGTSVEFELQVAREWPERMSAKTAIELHLIVSEAIDNAVHHGGARKVQVALCLEPGSDMAVITITDDGTGMDARHSGDRPGFGIVGMQERAGLLGGQVSLAAAPGGRGTRVQVTVPAPAVGAPKPGG